MTVATEACYSELQWTGAETSFAPGFAAAAASDVKVRYLDADGVAQPLTINVHYLIALNGVGAVTVTPLALPSASPSVPVTLIFERDTPALQGTDFQQLQSYSPAIHTTLHDRAFRILGELKARLGRAIQPFTTASGYVDFRPYRVKAAEPVDDTDLATKLWVLTITGVADIASYVAACAASAVAAAASAVTALGYQTGAQTARDKAQAWSDTAEDTLVPGTAEYSAYHWSRKALAQASVAAGYANTLTTAIHDWGNFQGANTVAADWGDFH